MERRSVIWLRYQINQVFGSERHLNQINEKDAEEYEDGDGAGDGNQATEDKSPPNAKSPNSIHHLHLHFSIITNSSIVLNYCI